mgnify:CR=1 FL=1
MVTLIKGGYVVNPATGLEGVNDVLIVDETVTFVMPGSPSSSALFPAFITPPSRRLRSSQCASTTIPSSAAFFIRGQSGNRA